MHTILHTPIPSVAYDPYGPHHIVCVYIKYTCEPYGPHHIVKACEVTSIAGGV